jgi:hypothetical protein
VERGSLDKLAGPDADVVMAAVAEIERLMGDSAQRRGRWGDLHRHMHFGQAHDWHDIYEFDWPSVRADIEAAGFSDTEPLPVPDIDLGDAAGGHLTGAVTVALPWDRLDDEAFERLLFNLIQVFPEYQNVQLLTNTRAPDRGGTSPASVTRDSTGEALAFEGGGRRRDRKQRGADQAVAASCLQVVGSHPTPLRGSSSTTRGPKSLRSSCGRTVAWRRC